MFSQLDLIRKIPNKGKTHIFLGSPLSDGYDKTTVEPGNSYSPGVRSCGISHLVEYEGSLYPPEILGDSEIEWGFDENNGLPPVVKSSYCCGKQIRVESSITHLNSQGIDFNKVNLYFSAATEANFYILVKDIGPAGGKISSLSWDKAKNTLVINSNIGLIVEQAPSECIILPADDEYDSPMAAIKYSIDMKAGGSLSLGFKTVHRYDERSSADKPYNISAETGFIEAKNEWKQSFLGKVFAPDARIEQVWERSIFHILSAMECGIPRIGAVNYPIFWMRDGVIILRALDLIGRHDLARIGCDYLSTLYFSGGFGAESDAPGESIWALVSHGRITGDNDWLISVFPYIKKRLEWIEKMMDTKEILRMPCENRIPAYVNNSNINILAYPAQNGLIHGRMDGHSPDFFINSWAQCGLKLGAYAAEISGEVELCKKYNMLAEGHRRAMLEHLIPQYGNDRDPIIAPYPSSALDEYPAPLEEKFRDWYLKNRIASDGTRNPEPYWTYFEAAQIHNAILLGLKNEAWINLNGMLDSDSKWDVSAFVEGVPGGNEHLPFRNDVGMRGWLSKDALAGNMPHNWTSAEMVNLIRDILVVEEGNTLILGKGIPKDWLIPGSSFGVKDMPTDFGSISYTVTVDSDGKINLNYVGYENYRLGF